MAEKKRNYKSVQKGTNEDQRTTRYGTVSANISEDKRIVATTPESITRAYVLANAQWDGSENPASAAA